MVHTWRVQYIFIINPTKSIAMFVSVHQNLADLESFVGKRGLAHAQGDCRLTKELRSVLSSTLFEE